MKKLGLFVLVAFLMGASGAFAQDVQYNFAQGTDFSKYKTYKWVSIKNTQQVDELTAKQLTVTIDAELAKKGLTKSESDSADLYVENYQRDSSAQSSTDPTCHHANQPNLETEHITPNKLPPITACNCRTHQADNPGNE